MDMGRILAIFHDMKNVNLDGGAMSQQIEADILPENQINCSQCYDTGIQDCSNCNGKGYIDADWDTMNCGHCFGKGSYPCTRCNPQGYADFLESEGEVNESESRPEESLKEAAISFAPKDLRSSHAAEVSKVSNKYNPKYGHIKHIEDKYDEMSESITTVLYYADAEVGISTQRTQRTKRNGATFCHSVYSLVKNSKKIEEAHEYWVQDEMNYPGEDKFEEPGTSNIEGHLYDEKHTGEDEFFPEEEMWSADYSDDIHESNNFKYTYSREQVKALEERELFDDVKKAEKGQEISYAGKVTLRLAGCPISPIKLKEDICSCGEKTVAPGVRLCDVCYKKAHDHATNRVNNPRRREEDKLKETVDSDLSNFVHAYVQNEEKKRRATEYRRQMEHEIQWCQEAIKKLEVLVIKKPSKIKEINDLKRQIREKEVNLAFNPMCGAEVRELPVERQMVDKLSEEDMGMEPKLSNGVGALKAVKATPQKKFYPEEEMWGVDYDKELDESSSIITKLAKRKLEGKCIGCGNKPCSCKSKGKLRNRKKFFKNASYEPSATQIDNEVEHLRSKKKVTEGFSPLTKDDIEQLYKEASRECKILLLNVPANGNQNVVSRNAAALAGQYLDISKFAKSALEYLINGEISTAQAVYNYAVDSMQKADAGWSSLIKEGIIREVAPSDKESWVKKNKKRFKKEYGKKKGNSVLYATAWKQHNKDTGGK